MAHGLYFVAKYFAIGQEHAIELCAGAKAQVPVIDIIKAIHLFAFFLLRGHIPRMECLVAIHAVGEIERGVDVDIIKQGEAAADRDAVLHAVAPILDQIRVKQFTFFRVNRVAELPGITDGDFLIPPLGTHNMPPLERIEAGKIEVEIGQGEGNGLVAHVLIKIGGGAECESNARERCAPAHR